MLSTGALIWVSLRPLLRLSICTAAGFIITKADIFPLVAARGAGQIMLNIALPCLMFSKIVPAFTPQNISALGPLVLVGALYELLGIGIAWVVKQFFWVPHRFRYGILVAGGWSNWGDVPTAVIMTITGASPFVAAEDQNLSIAYISAFILVFFVSLFPMGGHYLITKDYVGPEVEDDEVRMSMATKTRQSFQQLLKGTRRVSSALRSRKENPRSGDDPEKAGKEGSVTEDLKRAIIDAEEESDYAQRRVASSNQRRVTFSPDDATVVTTERAASRVCSPAQTELGPSRVTSPAPTVTMAATDPTPRTRSPSPSRQHPPPTVGPNATVPASSPRLTHRILAQARTAAMSMLNPPAVAILTAFPIALVTPLKALFTPLPSGSGNSPIPNAPDGQPPLAFVLDTATFIGGASVPLGLICLGSALARLKLPRGGVEEWAKLPVGAIVGLAVGKMVLMPVLGVLIVEGLVSSRVIDAQDKVLRFVCIFFSCVPTATTQVFLTQVYSGTGNADHLSAFLIPQYALMFVTMTALTAFTLSLLF